MLSPDIHHDACSMLLAPRRRLPSLDTGRRLLCAGKMGATPATRMSTMPSSARCLQYAAFLTYSTLKPGALMQEAREQPPERTFTMPSSAPFLQLAAALLPCTLKAGRVPPELCEQLFIRTLTMPSSAWFLQYAACLVPPTLKLAIVTQQSCKQSLVLDTVWCLLRRLEPLQGKGGHKRVCFPKDASMYVLVFYFDQRGALTSI